MAEIGGEVDREVAEKMTFEVEEDDFRDLQQRTQIKTTSQGLRTRCEDRALCLVCKFYMQ